VISPKDLEQLQEYLQDFVDHEERFTSPAIKPFVAAHFVAIHHAIDRLSEILEDDASDHQ
jgi:hypothetical protein